MFHRTRTTGLENQQDSMLPDIATALVPINSTAWKTAQHFSYGARGFMRVPVSEANDLNYLLGHLAKSNRLFLVSHHFMFLDSRIRQLICRRYS
jgi:hypothetical protein